MADTMTLEIITPDAIVYNGESSFIAGEAIDGGFGILPHHAPMIIALDMAPIRIDHPDKESELYAVFGGFMEISHNKVSIITPGCESPDSIDVDRAQRARSRAEDRLGNITSDIDIERAEMALARALLRLKITNRL